MNPALAELRLGTTLFSFSRELYTGLWTTEECVEHATALPGEQWIEIVGSQSLAGYPEHTERAEAVFRDTCERLGVELSCYDADLDLGWIAGRPFSKAQIVDQMIREMNIAHRLGFPMLRINTASRDLISSLLPTAESLGLSVVVELHARTIEHPEIHDLAEYFDKINSPHVGFLQDLGSFTARVPTAFSEYKRKSAMPSRLVSIMVDGYESHRPMDDVVDEVTALGASEVDISAVVECYSMFKNTSVNTLAQVQPHLLHVHAKLYEMVDGDEPCIPYPEIVKVLKAGGYQGVLSTEYGGFQFIRDPIGFEQVKAHHQMIRELWGQVDTSSRPTAPSRGRAETSSAPNH